MIYFGITLAVAFKVENLKKENNIQTYQEIVAFMNGQTLDEIEQAKESGKRIYQKILLTIGAGLLTLGISAIMILIFR